MKILLALITAAALQACETIPVEGKACYVTKDGQTVCVVANGKTIRLDATFVQQK